VIKVNNSVDPVFTGCNNITVDAFGEDCDAMVELVIGATDDCTPESELVYSYEIDLNNDGTIDVARSGNDASDVFDTGLHKIIWYVEDMCGNQTMCMHTFNVVDKKKPTPYCLSEITTVIMPSSGEIDIWAWDFDLGSFDNCPGDLRFSFSSDVSDTDAIFYCEDVGIQLLEIWVTDAAGNQDFCTTQINIQANEGCNGSRIGGDIHAENTDPLEEVMVTLENIESNESIEFMTPNSGHYQFLNLTAGTDYELTAEKDTDHRNGVNTLDIVKIQRHILGLESLDSPYKIIAADANNDGRIKASDLLTIRKLVLGVTTEFPSNSSWRFVDASFEFADAQDPFPFKENINVNDFDVTTMDNHFMAIKIGDVDLNASTSNFSGGDDIESRSDNSLNISIADQGFKAGEIVTVPFTASEFSEMIGMQFTLEAAGLSFESVTEGAIDMAEGNIASSNDALAVSWNDINAQSYEEGEILFTVNFRARTNGNLSDVITISSSVTNAEAYTPSYETVDVEIEVRNSNENLGVAFELKQNAPNPFADNTTVTFVLPQGGNAILSVFDITGKVLTSINGYFEKGTNEVNIDASQLNSTGVMYYQLEFNGEVATRKMISIAK